METKTIKDSENYVGYKVRLFPTKEQEKLFYEYFRMSRFVYNKTIDIQEEQYQKYQIYKQNPDQYDTQIYKRLSAQRIGAMFTKLKKEEKYSWLSKYSSESIKSVIRDCCTGYAKSDNIKLRNKRPKYKSRIYSKKQFPVRFDRLTISDKCVILSSIGNVKYCNSYGDKILGCSNKNKQNITYLHYSNPRVSFDGNYFYLSFTIPKDKEHQVNSYHNYYENEEWQEEEYSEAIGIDVGLKNDKWFVDSTGTKVERPNSDVLHKKINRLQRKYDRQKNTNLKKNSSFLEQHPNGSKNMQKTLDKINKCYKKITNRRRNAVHEYACSLFKKKPKAIVMESISSQRFINKFQKYTRPNKNKLKNMTLDAALYDSMQIIEYKMINNGIPVTYAEPGYPSSQICSYCGYKQDIKRRKIYRCPVCGTVIDRDLNAAINLKNLAY